MSIAALVAQFPVSLSIQQNLDSIQRVLEQARPGDLVVLPKGSISGYSLNLSLVSNWYLDQCRTDLVTIGPGENILRREK